MGGLRRWRQRRSRPSGRGQCLLHFQRPESIDWRDWGDPRQVDGRDRPLAKEFVLTDSSSLMFKISAALPI
jgi:hypothetical protein